MTLGQMPHAILRGVIDDDHLADLELRNRERAKELIQQLGERWSCHPVHAPQREKRQRCAERLDDIEAAEAELYQQMMTQAVACK